MSARERSEMSGNGATWGDQSLRISLVSPVSLGLPIARETLADSFSIAHALFCP